MRNYTAGELLRRQRIATFVTLAILLICIANYYFGWGVFGQFAKQVMLASLLAAAVQMHYFAPSISRMRAFQRLKRMRASQHDRSSGA